MTASGATDGVPNNATLLGYLSSYAPASFTLSAAQTNGTTTYTFDSGSEAFDYLRAGDTLTLTYDIRAADNDLSTGGANPQTADHQVVVTIAGTNDVSHITASASPASVDEAADAHAQSIGPITGTVTATDLDIGDTLTGNATGDAVVQLNGVTVASPSALGLENAITFDPASTNGGAIDLTYTYNPGAVNLDFLNSTDVLTVTYTLHLNDGHANSDNTTQVAITINGTNDAPTLSASSAGTLTDTAIYDTFTPLTGSLPGADVDEGAVLTYALAPGQDAISDYGTLTLNTDGSYSYAANDAAINALPAGSAITDTFNVQVSDGIATTASTLSVTIDPVNDTAAVSGTSSGDVTEAAGSRTPSPIRRPRPAR